MAHIFNAHCLSLSSRSLPQVQALGNGGRGVTIGIVDSVAQVKKYIRRQYNINETEDFVDSHRMDSMGHGTAVFHTIAAIAPNATFNFYRIFDGKQDIHQDDLLEPIKRAEEDGVDLLNISAGAFSPSPSPHDRVSTAVREATNSGVQVIAASGNLENNPDEKVNSPAVVDEAIAVGAFKPWCTGAGSTPKEVMNFSSNNPDSSIYWADTSSLPDSVAEVDFQGPYCGQTDCSASHECSRNRSEEWWSRNVEPRNGKPDILAPPMIPQNIQGKQVMLSHGTSYSCPLVTGLLANTCADLLPDNPTPQQIQDSVLAGGVTIDDGSGMKFNLERTKSRLESVI
jgi:hypothetical protein